MKKHAKVSLAIVAFIFLFPVIDLTGAQATVVVHTNVKFNSEAFLEACRSGDVATLEMLLTLDATHLDIDYCNENGDSALHLAVINEHAAICALLLQSEIDLHLKDDDGETALRKAAIQNNRAILEEFRKAKIIGTQEENSQNLLRACGSGSLEDVEGLLELQGSDYVDINETDDQGNSALHLAVLAGHASICDLLITSGIDTRLHNNDTFTALDLAHECDDEEILEVIKNGTTTEDIIGNLVAFTSDTERDGSDNEITWSDSEELFNLDIEGDGFEDRLSDRSS